MGYQGSAEPVAASREAQARQRAASSINRPLHQRALLFVFCVNCLLESANTLAQTFAEFRQLFGAKHDYRYDQDDEQVQGLKQTFKHFFLLLDADRLMNPKFKGLFRSAYYTTKSPLMLACLQFTRQTRIVSFWYGQANWAMPGRCRTTQDTPYFLCSRSKSTASNFAQPV